MQVEVRRSGGFAGLTRVWRVDSEQGPQRLAELVDACPWEVSVPSASGADRFVYRLTAGERSIELPEPAVTGPWRQLIDLVLEAGTAE